ncbi:site-specific DNA-methyltransferase, partial [Campylobacter fetus]
MIDKKNIKKANIIESLGQNELYATLKTKFPQTIDSDGAVNFDAIKMLLGIGVKENIKGYELNWIGKGLANALYNTPCDKELKFEPTKSKDTDTTQNVIIRGDNLDALKLLKSAYYEKIKLIYIDPPYNTKNDDFIYPDDFRRDFRQILLEIGLLTIETDENGNEVEVKSEVLNFFTNITSTKSHSGWLSFMLPRLKLARDLLREDGVIFISIDDNEQANSKILCDEIFGEENFISCMPRVTKKAGKSTDQIANNHDYVLVYSKDKATFKQIFVNESDYNKQDNFFDERGGYKLNQTLDYDSLQYNKTMDYEIIIGDQKFYPGSSESKFIERLNGKFNRIDWVWRWSKSKFEFGLENGFVEILNGRIYTKTYFKAKISSSKPYKIETIKRTKNISSIELLDNKFSNDSANKILQKIFNQKNIFEYSKSVELIKFF